MNAATRSRLLPLAAAATTVVLWASAFVAIRAIGHDLSPGALALGRMLLGALTLTAILTVVRARRRTSGPPLPADACWPRWRSGARPGSASTTSR